LGVDQVDLPAASPVDGELCGPGKIGQGIPARSRLPDEMPVDSLVRGLATEGAFLVGGVEGCGNDAEFVPSGDKTTDKVPGVPLHTALAVEGEGATEESDPHGWDREKVGMGTTGNGSGAGAGVAGDFLVAERDGVANGGEGSTRA